MSHGNFLKDTHAKKSKVKNGITNYSQLCLLADYYCCYCFCSSSYCIHNLCITSPIDFYCGANEIVLTLVY